MAETPLRSFGADLQSVHLQSKTPEDQENVTSGGWMET